MLSAGGDGRTDHFSHGKENFVRMQDAGFSGLIVPDLPADEAAGDGDRRWALKALI